MGEDLSFLNAQKEGLAVFINKHELKTYRLPHAFEETVIADNIFHIKPLLPVLTENIDYYILAISKNTLALYSANRFEINPIDIPDMPKYNYQYTGKKYKEVCTIAKERISYPGM
jgi:hypothetical protein